MNGYININHIVIAFLYFFRYLIQYHYMAR
nr:MAG TPA: hypothetical protein [Caudoviricetes sp.]